MAKASILPRASHVGVSVSDMERSLAFYTQGLGFSEGVHVVVENNHNELFGIEGPVAMQSKFLKLGGLTIELIEFTKPSAIKSPEMRELFRTGLTHLSFHVADIAETVERLAQLGGKIHPATRTVDSAEGRNGSIIFCTDPDGTRIELMAYDQQFDFA